jgi:hypothetical protein
VKESCELDRLELPVGECDLVVIGALCQTKVSSRATRWWTVRGYGVVAELTHWKQCLFKVLSLTPDLVSKSK